MNHLFKNIMAVMVCGVVYASEHFEEYDINQPRLSRQQTQRALEYERAYNKDTKERTEGFYNRIKSALGFKSLVPRPRVAEYEAAFSKSNMQKKKPWDTRWYEHRTYEERLPSDIKKALDAHQRELAEMRGSVSSFEWLPGYVVKPDPRKYSSNQFGYSNEDYERDRIEGAKVFTSAIKAQRNPMIYIPQKYEYAAKDPGGTVKNYYITEKVPTSNEPITKEEAKAIAKIASLAEWADPHSSNFIKMAPGRIAIIDTEPRFFYPALKESALKKGINRTMLRYSEPFGPEAIDYLKTKNMKMRNLSSFSYKPWHHILLEKNRRWQFLVPPSKKDFYSQVGL